MRFFKDTNVNFIGNRKKAYVFSGLLILAGIVSLVIHGGPKYNIDFTGGLQMELNLTPQKAGLKPLIAHDIRLALGKAGINDAEIQRVGKEGSEFLIKARSDGEGQTGNKIVEIVKAAFPEYISEDLVRIQDEVGPRIGNELKFKAIYAIIYSLIGIIIYIWWRFQLTYGIAAVIALFHDVMITVGIFSLTGKELSLTVIAALLTIVGYSLNDTIVVFDRIREDLRLYRREDFEVVINRSINETLSRTIITSGTTLLVVLSLFLFGGTVIHDFSFALLIGIGIGTYSSIFIASPILVENFTRKREKLENKK